MNLLLTSLWRGVYSAAEWEKVGDDGENNSPCRKHAPVMLDEVLQGLGVFPGAVILDCTVGYCGHAERILEVSAPHGVVIGIDRDLQAIESDPRRASRFGSRLQLVHGQFMDLKRHLSDRGISEVHGVLFDLGVSSPQLDEPSRGFSFQTQGPLDMRMDQTRGRTAADILSCTDETDLADMIFRYGEERYSRRIARSIVRTRQSRPILTTGELVSAVDRAVPNHYRRGRIHPATRTFQALRIAVNQELEHLETSLRDATDMLAPGGRLCVISFHSLEDRIVKRTFRSLSATKLDILTKKPQLPAREEARRNPRSRSAKLRIAQRRAQEIAA
ncbi:MAG TPA: 16S rRNA (cytosine(1402)-N(4))-methyltransferase RsmH [Nitrospira sp.]|nr:16S rRNA (cytosine(1402)-N(4))-methyltransferase RsmH [Nitrospira sp.]